MQHWEELVPNSWGSESWDFGPLCLDVLDQKAHKSVSSEMRTCDVTFALDRLIFGMKKRSRFLTTVLSCDNALFVSILLFLLASINSERRNCSFTVWEMSINICAFILYIHISKESFCPPILSLNPTSLLHICRVFFFFNVDHRNESSLRKVCIYRIGRKELSCNEWLFPMCWKCSSALSSTGI